jgi:hypothetical protein
VSVGNMTHLTKFLNIYLKKVSVNLQSKEGEWAPLLAELFDNKGKITR